MKVVCESCQAKYQVPDERVAGKKLKIRCKRCGATVLIRGDLIDNAAPQNGPALDRPSVAESLAPIETGTQDASAYEWHVSLDGDTRGPFNTDDLRDWLNNTPGGWEAHVWREGFPDWIDARACSELEPPPAPPAIASLQQDDELPTQTFQQHSSQFLSDVAAPQARPAVQASSIRSRAPSGISEPALRDDGAFFSPGLQAMAAPSYPSGSATATGLGSIAASSPAYIPGPNPGFANGEGSGLIDIRALASLARQSTTQIAKGPGVPTGSATSTGKHSIADTQLSYGSEDDEARIALANQPSAFGRLDSLAPVAHTPTSNAALPLAILGGCALVAAAVLAAVLFTRPNRSAEVVSTPPAAKEVQDTRAATAQPPNALEPVTEPAGSETKAADQAAPAPATKDAPAPAKEGAPGPGASAAPTDGLSEEELAAAKKRKQLAPRSAAEEDKNTTSPDEKAKPKKEEKPTQQDSPEVMLADKAKPVKQTPAPLPAAATIVAAAEPPKTTGELDSMLDGKGAKPQQAAQVQPSKSRSLDDLLSGATDKSAPAPGAAKPPAPEAAVSDDGASDLPEAPSRDETLAAMRGVESAVRACAAAEQITGTAEVAITVAGGTGRVTSANVTGITGTAGSCIARAVRNARFPHFTKPAFSIKYPYRF